MSALMIQGTTSDAGKTTLVAALGRYLSRQGLSVAPFKPQNMALNSSLTPEGDEVARSTLLQARACGVAPHRDMNPILLKPRTDRGAQVILRGRDLGLLQAADYQRFKRQAMEQVLDAWNDLSRRHRILLVEGAGSPAEINLRQDDLANMGFAERVDCPVWLISDIHRGGVFAHLVGTLELLSPSERARVQGLLINRFRGDPALLQGGLDWLCNRTGKPVLGVLPELPDLMLEAEDSLSDAGKAHAGAFRVVVPALPRLGHHADLDPLRGHPDVHLQWVGGGQPPPPADLMVIPSSEHLRGDLAWLRAQGWEAALQRHLRYGGKVLGLGTGLALLGEAVADPEGVEGPPETHAGLGLLALQSRLRPQTRRERVSGSLSWAQAPVEGFRVDALESSGPDLSRPLLRGHAFGGEGAISADGQVMASTVHDLLATPAACAALLTACGLPHVTWHDPAARREQELERLADWVEASLDTGALMRTLGLA